MPKYINLAIYALTFQPSDQNDFIDKFLEGNIVSLEEIKRSIKRLGYNSLVSYLKNKAVSFANGFYLVVYYNNPPTFG